MKRPSFSFIKFFSSTAWKVSALALTIGTLVITPNSKAEDATLEKYTKGNFATAQAEWSAAFADQPENWGIRVNAGLAAAQQDDWGYALAYWTNAFVLAPRNESIHWNLKLALNQTGAYDQTLLQLIKGKNVSKLIPLLSPGEWEAAANLTLYIIAALLLVWVISRYIRLLQPIGTPILILTALAIGFVIASHWAYSAYGLLTKENAVIVAEASDMKSLPTEVEVEQITTPLSEGAIAVVRKTFYGWSQIELANDEIGWVRTSTLVPVYSR